MHEQDPLLHALQEEYARALEMMDELTRFRKLWSGFHPMPPFKRSELALLGAVAHLSQGGRRSVTVGQLAKSMQQSAPAVSQKLNALEEAGFIARVGDETDRRVVYVELTAAGGQAAKQSVEEFLGRLERVLDILGEEKTRTVMLLLHELSDAIDEVQKQEGVEHTC